MGNPAVFFSREAQPQLICLFTVHSAVRAAPRGFSPADERVGVFSKARQAEWAEVAGAGARAPPGSEARPCPQACGRLCPCHSLNCTWVCSPRGRLAVPAPAATPASAFCGNGVSEALCHRPSLAAARYLNEAINYRR